MEILTDTHISSKKIDNLRHCYSFRNERNTYLMCANSFCDYRTLNIFRSRLTNKRKNSISEQFIFVVFKRHVATTETRDKYWSEKKGSWKNYRKFSLQQTYWSMMLWRNFSKETRPWQILQSLAINVSTFHVNYRRLHFTMFKVFVSIVSTRDAKIRVFSKCW